MRTLSISLLILLLFQVQLYSQVNGNFQCDIPVNGNGNCNIIPNSNFLLADPNITNSAFGANNVDGWYDAFGSVNINRYISSFDPSINFASMAVGGRLNGEELVVKIPNLIQGHEYLYSFFVASNDFDWTAKSPNVSFSSVLINCQDFPLSESSPYVPITTPNQPIYCEYLGEVGSSPWRQVVVKFTAENNFNMLRIFPSMSAVPNYSSLSFLHYAFPEIIDVTPISNFSTGTASFRFCTGSFLPRNCSVRNSVFTWKDPNGNILQQGGIQSINLSMPPNLFGLYTLSMSVPSASTTNNTCSINQPIISTTVDIPYNCRCKGGLEVSNANISIPLTGYDADLIDCNLNRICNLHMDWDYTYQFSGEANQTVGNIWKVRIIPDQNFSGAPSYVNYFGSTVNYPATENYYTYSTTSNGFLEFQLDAPFKFTVEILLENSVTNSSIKYLLQFTENTALSPYSFYCIQTSPTYPYPHKIYLATPNQPGMSYLWSFPVGINPLTPVTNYQVEWDDSNYSGSNPIANLEVSNTYGCPSLNLQLNIDPSMCMSAGLMENKKQIKATDFQMQNARSLKSLRLYPLPALDVLTIETNKKMIFIELIDARGIRVKYLQPYSRIYQIKTENVNKGIYFLRVIYDDNTYETKMIFKN